MNTHQPNMTNPDLSRDVDTAPEEIKPVIGALHYGRTARAKLLITDLVQYVVKETLEPIYPPLIITEPKARAIFAALDDLLTKHDLYSHLGMEMRALVQATRDVPFRPEDLRRLQAEARALGDAPDVRQAFDAYMEGRHRGYVTCFFCGKEVDEGGTDSSSEFGIYYACDVDWRRFGNADGYI